MSAPNPNLSPSRHPFSPANSNDPTNDPTNGPVAESAYTHTPTPPTPAPTPSPTTSPTHASVSTSVSTSVSAPEPAPAPAPLRCLTIDVEEYYHIEAAHPAIDKSTWPDWPRRVEPITHKILDLLADHRIRATFFVLGDVVDRSPNLARTIHDAGHEVASHGNQHDRLHRLTPDTFRKDLLDSKHKIEDETGAPVLGYRAPSFSLTRQTSWATNILLESGFRYDASIFGVRHPAYGVTGIPDTPFYLKQNPTDEPLLEIPPLTWRIGKRHLAAAGGGYFRLLPLAFMKRGLTQAARENRPAVLYFHPWEFDPGIKKMNLPLTRLNRIRTYTGLSRSFARLKKILTHSESRWQTLAASQLAFHQLARRTPPFLLHNTLHASRIAS